jgi:glyoxylase-like metal-dependent hydrolase (beta-lactamase superfamily II)
LQYLKDFPLGNTTITQIIEREGPYHRGLDMFPKATEEAIDRHIKQLPAFAWDATTKSICITFQSWLLRTPYHNILIDTCVGEHGNRRAGLLYSKKRRKNEFASTGLTFEDIDYVFCTHLHVDHVGWNTQHIDGRLVPTFPNAKYVIGRKEFEWWDHWTKNHPPHPSGPAFQECVLPVVEAGQALLVEDDFELNDLIHLSAAPGHTMGQYCAHLKSSGAKAIFTGDAMHHPLQIFEPGWSTMRCTDMDLAIKSRKKILDEIVDTETKLITAHFPGHTVGHVIGKGDAFHFQYLEI